MRYFSLGQIQFTDINGAELNSVRPVEMAFDLNYARQLTNRFGLAVGLRYINSNLGSTDTDRFISQGAAADISMFHTNPVKVKKLEGLNINWGLAITNIGTKMSYSANALNKDFIPANFALGLGAEIKIDEYNKVGIYTDVNKLLIDSWMLGVKTLYYQHSMNSAQAFARKKLNLNDLQCVACEG